MSIDAVDAVIAVLGDTIFEAEVYFGGEMTVAGDAHMLHLVNDARKTYQDYQALGEAPDPQKEETCGNLSASLDCVRRHLQMHMGSAELESLREVLKSAGRLYDLFLEGAQVSSELLEGDGDGEESDDDTSYDPGYYDGGAYERKDG